MSQEHLLPFIYSRLIFWDTKKGNGNYCEYRFLNRPALTEKQIHLYNSIYSWMHLMVLKSLQLWSARPSICNFFKPFLYFQSTLIRKLEIQSCYAMLVFAYRFSRFIDDSDHFCTWITWICCSRTLWHAHWRNWGSNWIVDNSIYLVSHSLPKVVYLTVQGKCSFSSIYIF